MATISARVDERLKAAAENVADSIGIPLSTAITVFLKRFAADKGFPFDVVVTKQMEQFNRFTPETLEKVVKDAIADRSTQEPSDVFSYFDSESGAIKRYDISGKE